MKKALVITNKPQKYLVGYSSMIDPLNDLGFKVTWAANFSNYIDNLEDLNCDTKQVDFESNPFKTNNIRSYFQLKKIMTRDDFDLVHCNTPIGGLIGRMIAQRTNTKNIIYTAHGFHFYKGGNFFKNIIFKNGEKVLARITDVLITINNEDYEKAKDFKLRGGKKGDVMKVSGVGIKLPNKVSISRDNSKMKVLNYRKSEILGINLDDSTKIIISVGSLNKNKNNKVIIRSLSNLTNLDFIYVICGNGPEEKNLKELVKKESLEKKVLFAGFRTDMDSLYSISDIFVMPSFREGLPRSLMEAMSFGLPCIISDIRGNRDLLDDGYGGYLVADDDEKLYRTYLKKLITSDEVSNEMGAYNIERVKQYSIEEVNKEMIEIYRKFL